MSDKTDTDNAQQNWFALIEREGSEDSARAYLVRQLRAAADQVELDLYPRVFGCCLPLHGLTGDSFIGVISVTLSHPWPG